ncbi:MAG TPA: hypothetical protein VF079_06730 [Sphingomicrobium sp.]
MITRAQFDGFLDHPVVEWSMFVIGVLLLVVSPLVGVIPGPGGIIVAGIGLALILKTSLWAKRHYVRFKRWRPKLFGRRLAPGHWTDLALRRRSALRRERRRKEQEQLAKAQEASSNN